MPIHKEGSGFQWGGKGKVYSTRAGAAKQAAAAHANGFSGDKMSKAELLKQVCDAIDCMIAGLVAKDAVSHDPSNGQFAAGGGSGGGKEVGKNALRDTHVNMHNSSAEQHTKQGDHHNAIGKSLKESGNWKGSMHHFQAGAAHHIAATWHKDAAQAHSEGAPDRKKKSSDAAEASNEAVEATRSAQIKDQPSAGKHKP